jgi:hypothetical protein
MEKLIEIRLNYQIALFRYMTRPSLMNEYLVREARLRLDSFSYHYIFKKHPVLIGRKWELKLANREFLKYGSDCPN